jgi:hypothetical protein
VLARGRLDRVADLERRVLRGARLRVCAFSDITSARSISFRLSRSSPIERWSVSASWTSFGIEPSRA